MTVSARRVVAGEVNLAAELAPDLRADHNDLVDAPAVYDGVADRACATVRATYLDRVLATLDHRANQAATASDAASNENKDAEFGSFSETVRAEEVARAVLGDLRADGANGTVNESGVRFVPDVDPMYPSLGGFDGAAVPTVARGDTYYLLVAHSTNLFTLPYGDAADTVLKPLFDANRRVPLRIAARTFPAVDSTLENTNATNEAPADRRNRLETVVDRPVALVEEVVRHTLRDHTNHSATKHQRTLEHSLGAWDDPARRALAIMNGFAARAIAVEAAAPGTVEADLLELRLDDAFRAARGDRSTTVPQRLTSRTIEITRTARQQAVSDTAIDATMSATEDAVTGRLNDTLDSWFDTSFKCIPAGMSVTPVPGSWYATVNVWDVAAAGEFAQFRVHARGDAESLMYARDGSTVILDWDGDGTAETVGRDDRVSFDAETTTVVAVLPLGAGVGDTDDNAGERPEGWQGGSGYTVAADYLPDE